jgi:4-hydroxy-4-methyl-2-oxoglutarate aldolase
MTDLFETLKTKLFTAVVGDILDQLGFVHQFLPAQISPLQPGMRLVGRAMPVLVSDVFDKESTSAGPLSSKPFGLMLEALDDLQRDEVYIASGASLRYALFGELMATRAKHLGAAGAVLDGYVRDAGGIESLDFPCFGRGVYAQDQGPRGKVMDFRCSIEIEGVRISPGDLLFGDREGVIVIPKQVEGDAISLALTKVSGENEVAEAIRNGMSAVEAYATHGVM